MCFECKLNVFTFMQPYKCKQFIIKKCGEKFITNFIPIFFFLFGYSIWNLKKKKKIVFFDTFMLCNRTLWFYFVCLVNFLVLVAEINKKNFHQDFFLFIKPLMLLLFLFYFLINYGVKCLGSYASKILAYFKFNKSINFLH